MPIQHDHVDYIHNSSVYIIKWFSLSIFSRGIVEDTRLETKDTKKFWGQGHRCKCSKKKKSSKNFFQAISKKRSSKIFFRRKRSKTFFQAISTWGKQKKSFKFSARFLAFSNKISTIQKMLTTGQFSRTYAEERAIFKDLRLQSQGLQNMSSRPRTSSRTQLLIIGQLTQL